MIPSLYQRFSRDALWSALSNLLVTLQGLLVLPLLTKAVPVAEYGAWVQVGVTIGLTVILTVVGLDQALMRFAAAKADRAEVRGALLAAALTAGAVSLLPAVALVAGSDLLAAHWLRQPAAATLLRLAGPIVVVGTLQRFVLIYFRTRRQIFTYSCLWVAEVYGQLAATALLLWLGHGVASAALGMLLGKSAALLAGAVLAWRQLGTGLPDLGLLPEYLAFGLPLVPTALFVWINNLIDRYVVNYFAGAASVGVYAVAYNVGFLTSLFFAPFFLVFVPAASRLWEEGRPGEIRALTEISLRYLLYLTLPTVVGASVLARQLIRAFATEAYTAGWLVVPIVGLAYLAFNLADVHVTIITLGRRTGVLVYVYGASAALNVLLNLALVPTLGIVGAALATLATFIAIPLALAPFSARLLAFRLPWPAAARAAVAAAIMGALVWYLAPPRLPQVLATVPLAAATYALALLLLGGFAPRELALARRAGTAALRAPLALWQPSDAGSGDVHGATSEGSVPGPRGAVNVAATRSADGD